MYAIEEGLKKVNDVEVETFEREVVEPRRLQTERV